MMRQIIATSIGTFISGGSLAAAYTIQKNNKVAKRNLHIIDTCIALISSASDEEIRLATKNRILDRLESARWPQNAWNTMPFYLKFQSPPSLCDAFLDHVKKIK